MNDNAFPPRPNPQHTPPARPPAVLTEFLQKSHHAGAFPGPPDGVADQPDASYDQQVAAVSSLDIQLSDGGRIGVPYHLLRPLRFDAKGGRIEIRCDTLTVQVSGHALEPVYRGILTGRISMICPVADARFSTGTEPVIRQIAVVDEMTP